jgi:hypothetical protein
MRRAAQSWSQLLGCAILAVALMPMTALAQDDPVKEEITGEQIEETPAEKPASEEPAEPKEAQEGEAKEETSAEADEHFAKSFRGKTYQGDLEIEGWDDLGGGLVLPPIYVRQYQREDGTFLVLTSREVVPPSSDNPASYVVADALVIPPPKEGVDFTIACVQGEDETLRFMGEASGKEDKEWWTDVKRAWEISIETGEIAEAKTKGVRCTNISWGQ